MNIKRALLILGATLIASAPVQAALSITPYTDKAAWKAAVSGEQTETFNAETKGEFTYRVFNGFTIESNAFYTTSITETGDAWCLTQPCAGTLPDVNGTRFVAFATEVTETEAMTIVLDEPTQALGFDWRNSDPSGDAARFTLVVNGQYFDLPAGQSGFFGIVATNGGFASVKIEDAPGGGGDLTGLGIDDFSFVSADVALFKVTKTFVPASNAPVNVRLTCDSGLPLEQTATIRGGDPEGVTFVLTNTQASPDCVVTETPVSGYAGSPANCTFNDVSNLNYTCAFTNTAQPVRFGFTKIWDVDGNGGDLLDKSSELTIECSAPITGNNPAAQQSGTFFRTWRSTAGAAAQAYSVDVNATGTTPRCWVTEDVKDSAVEVTRSGACGTQQSPVAISIGNSVTSCTITNTVFYEGIPTLSQYGMAIMALLMLGVGFVGFRRFV